jgi:hypothetical protein
VVDPGELSPLTVDGQTCFRCRPLEHLRRELVEPGRPEHVRLQAAPTQGLSTTSSGSVNQKVLPAPGVLSAEMEPFISPTSS